MVCQKGHIETQCQPLCCTQKHDTEEGVDEVLGEYKLEGKTQAGQSSKCPDENQLLIWRAGGNQVHNEKLLFS